jgi:LPPG:FO 2-phospho-L-lactate transferase
MKSIGVEVSAIGVARIYRDFLDTMVLDQVDRNLAKNIESLGMKAVVAGTIMRRLTDKIRLARIVVRELE